MRRRSWFAGFAILCLILPPPEAWAWGSEGHRVIADIAWDHLNETTRRNLRPFLGDSDLASISTWADDIRPARPETAPWHYVNISADSPGYQPKDCLHDNCVVAQIDKFARILADPQQPFAARSEALKYLVHFVGDIHQPMHAIGDARGGNDIPVSFFGSPQCGDRACNLHRVWDTELVQHNGLGEQQYARELEGMIAADHLQAGPGQPAAWANDSLQLARQAWVQPHTNIAEAYYLKERPVINRQLALAGLRLARLLNEELGGAAKS